MLFNSLEFPLFLGFVLLGHYAVLPRGWWRARKAFLLVASYAFYASWSPFFTLLLLGTTLLDFGAALGMERAARPAARRAFITASLSGNLGLLGYFKYGNFLAENLHRLLGPWGLVAAPLADIEEGTRRLATLIEPVVRRLLATHGAYLERATAG